MSSTRASTSLECRRWAKAHLTRECRQQEHLQALSVDHRQKRMKLRHHQVKIHQGEQMKRSPKIQRKIILCERKTDTYNDTQHTPNSSNELSC